MAPVIEDISTAVLPILQVLNALVMLPVEVIRGVFAAMEDVSLASDNIEFEIGKVAQHYQELDYSTAVAADNIEEQAKQSQRLKMILSGFDELNILNKEDPIDPLGGDKGLETAEEMDELIKEWVKWQTKAQDAQKELNKYYQQGADKLGITRDQFKQLWDAYSNKDFTTYYKLLGDFELDTTEADRVMSEFDAQCGDIVRGLQSDLNIALTNAGKVYELIQQSGIAMD